MHDLRMGLATVIVAAVIVGIIRVARGPTFEDRLLVTQLFGTSGVAVLLLLGAGDVALIFALLASITVVAFASRR